MCLPHGVAQLLYVALLLTGASILRSAVSDNVVAFLLEVIPAVISCPQCDGWDEGNWGLTDWGGVLGQWMCRPQELEFYMVLVFSLWVI